MQLQFPSMKEGSAQHRIHIIIYYTITHFFFVFSLFIRKEIRFLVHFFLLLSHNK
jgi:hypothetical protein